MYRFECHCLGKYVQASTEHRETGIPQQREKKWEKERQKKNWKEDDASEHTKFYLNCMVGDYKHM